MKREKGQKGKRKGRRVKTRYCKHTHTYICACIHIHMPLCLLI